MRGHCFFQVLNNNSGRALSNVKVEVLRSETQTHFDGTLFQSADGSDVYPNPYIAPQGTVDFYLEENTIVDLSISYRNMTQYVKNIAVIDPLAAALPEGGTEGQFLSKTTEGATWVTLSSALTFTSNDSGLVIITG